MKRGAIIFWSLLVALAIGRLVFSSALSAPDIGPCLNKEVAGQAVIVAEPERKESGQTIVLATKRLEVFATSTGEPISDCRVDIQVRVKAKSYPRFAYGDRVIFEGKIIRPFNFSNDDGRSFDYRGYLAKDDIYLEMKSVELSTIDTSSSTSDRVVEAGISIETVSGTIESILFRIKRGFVGNLERALGEPHAALAAGLVVGEKSALGKDLLDDFRTVGLIHIVVLSGFNITVVADAIRKLLSRLPRVWGIFLGGIGIALFGVMVGGGATVVRSCAMAGVALFADLIRRDYSVGRALGLAGLVMVIQNPMILLHDPSFQLSFLATVGLILLSGPIERRILFLPEKFGVRQTVAATFATQIFVSPYILYTMGQLSIIGVVVNILVLPLIPLTMLAVFLTGAAGFILAPLSQCFGWLAHFFLSYELFMVKHFARLPFASVHIPAFSFWWVMGFYLSFFLILFFGKKKSINSVSKV